MIVKREWIAMKKLRSVTDLEFVCDHVDHVVTLFSGGLDSTYLLKLLSERGVEVTAVAVDLGDEPDIPALHRVASTFGAHLRVVDLKHTFAREAALPAIRAQARYLHNFPISASLSRPFMAQAAVDIAESLGCGAIFHTATQSQNSLRRINGAIEQLGYGGFYGSPHEYTSVSRSEKIRALKAAGLASFEQRIVSGDSNLWCREFESGVIENPEGFVIPESLFTWSRPDAERQTDIPGHKFSITFQAGVPVAVNDGSMEPVPLINHLNRIVGAYGIGRFTGLEHLQGGEKVLEVREAPAAQALMDAYRHLETAVHSYELIREKAALEQLWVREAVEGRWFGTLRDAIDHFILRTSQEVSGRVCYDVSGGQLNVESIQAGCPLYLKERDQWESQKAASSSARSLVDMSSSEQPSAPVPEQLALGA
ncbi:argininosuccinate synthase-related protein [Marinobacter fonticola]|uniref:argininosuccinate synthase-related protein n=1 Tax=Marinobacter fonticola TaxID=2603215 RepID=UPI001D0DA2BC|nr:argininosuccinate synthase-related protein [Marinobacter fonticola]